METLRARVSRLRYVVRHGIRRGFVFGYCPICERKTNFVREGEWLRDAFKCATCQSTPRFRAVIAVLESFYPSWREMAIHESSPAGPASDKIAHECRNCIQTHWYPGVPLGSMHEGFRCEDLEQQTFPDESFDLVVSQDVFEHILDPAKAFAEIARTLKPGGAHVFTIPWYYWKPTLVRASRDEAGGVQHHTEPDYHGNPIDAKGSLVTREWGSDLAEFILKSSGMGTTAVQITDRHRGIEAKFIEVFISRKPERPA